MTNSDAGILPPLIELLFTAAGWRPSACFGEPVPRDLGAAERAARIIGEFRGLHVGECGPGPETAASDVRFYATERPEVGLCRGTKRRPGSLIRRWLKLPILFVTAVRDFLCGSVSLWSYSKAGAA